MQNTVQLYLAKIDLTLSKKDINSLLKHVSKGSRKRINKFRFIEDALHTLYGEVMVRFMVSKQYSINIDQIEILKNTYGKPYIINPPIYFNISHAGEWVACAISGQNIGIDVELIKNENKDILDIARRFFHKEEYLFLRAKEESECITAFYDLWTLKESYIKWIGTGLTTPLNSFYFNISDNQIFVTDINQVAHPFFRQYPISGYKLSVCSTIPCFPDQIDFVDMKEIISAT